MKRSLLVVSMVLAGVAAGQEPDWSKVEVKVVPVAGGVRCTWVKEWRL